MNWYKYPIFRFKTTPSCHWQSGVFYLATLNHQTQANNIYICFIENDIVMNKQEIIAALEKQYEQLCGWLENQEDVQFEVNIPEKWSPGQHAEHLIKSTAPINKAMRMPKMALRTMFGKNNRDEKSYEQVVSRYQEKLATVTVIPNNQFMPKEVKNEQKQKTVARLKKEVQDLADIINKWDDKRLSSHLLPHPLLGKMTINEMLMFTVYHTEHHLNLLKRDYN